MVTQWDPRRPSEHDIGTSLVARPIVATRVVLFVVRRRRLAVQEVPSQAVPFPFRPPPPLSTRNPNPHVGPSVEVRPAERGSRSGDHRTRVPWTNVLLLTRNNFKFTLTDGTQNRPSR